MYWKNAFFNFKTAYCLNLFTIKKATTEYFRGKAGAVRAFLAPVLRPFAGLLGRFQSIVVRLYPAAVFRAWIAFAAATTNDA